MTDTGTPTWGEGVRILRGIKNLTQIELAAAARVPQATISRIETGSTRVSDSVRIRIAKALEVQAHELFPYIDDEQAEAADEQVSA